MIIKCHRIYSLKNYETFIAPLDLTERSFTLMDEQHLFYYDFEIEK